MFEDFSSGYYLGRLYVEAHENDCAVMQTVQHERVNRQLYATGEGVERLDWPLVMKLGTRHFPVLPADDVPDDTLVVPEVVVDDGQGGRLPALREVLLAKADHAARLLRMAGTHLTPTAMSSR